MSAPDDTGGRGLPFQNLVFALQAYWAKQGCVVLQPYDMEVGAGTFHWATALRALGPEAWNAAYVQPSRRPADGRFGENPNRLHHYYQFQVLMKPSPDGFQALFLASLEAIGIAPARHDIRFVEDDWESPTLGAWGLGWEVWCDGMEIAQFTYFQQVGGFDCRPVSGEITYGLERLAMYVQGVDHFRDIDWNGAGVSYGDVHAQAEREHCEAAFAQACPATLRRHFEDAEAACDRLARAGLPLPAYDQCIKAGHLFNLLDAAGAIGVAERASHIGRVRALARTCCAAWLASRGPQEEADGSRRQPPAQPATGP